MAIFLATRIINGKLSYEDVPDSLKEEVKKYLLEKDFQI